MDYQTIGLIVIAFALAILGIATTIEDLVDFVRRKRNERL